MTPWVVAARRQGVSPMVSAPPKLMDMGEAVEAGGVHALALSLSLGHHGFE